MSESNLVREQRLGLKHKGFLIFAGKNKEISGDPEPGTEPVTFSQPLCVFVHHRGNRLSLKISRSSLSCTSQATKETLAALWALCLSVTALIFPPSILL